MQSKTLSRPSALAVSYLDAARATATTRNLPPLGVLPKDGFVRQAQLVPHIIPISPATLWRWVKAGKFPAPSKLGPMITAWPVAAVREWLESQQSAA